MFEIRRASIFAKLLGGVNLTVSVSERNKTAAIDLENRVLHLPVWDISDTGVNGLIAHEIAHVFYTPVKEWVDFCKASSKGLKNVANIIEDYRIEYKIILKYPTLRNFFKASYREMYDAGKFGINNSFFSRLLRHLKLNETAHLNITEIFNDDERKDVDLVKTVRTFEDVLKVAQYLYEKYKDEEIPQFSINELSLEMVENPDDIDGEVIDIPVPMETLEEITKFIQKNRHRDIKNGGTYVIPLLKRGDFVSERNNSTVDNHQINLNETESLVRYAAEKFKYLADAYRKKNTRHVNTGVLDMKKVQNYWKTDNIFNIRHVVPKQINHGLILWVDGSGSMSSVWESVVLQSSILSRFANSLNIPNETYVFSNICKPCKTTLFDSGEWGVYPTFEYLEGKTKHLEQYKKMLNISLGSTPLSNSMLGLNTIIRDFKIKYPNVDKVNVLVVTDGGCDLGSSHYQLYSHGGMLVTTEKSVTNGVMDSTSAFYKIFTDLYDVNIVSLDIRSGIDYDIKIDTNHKVVKNHFVLSANSIKENSKTFLNSFLKVIA